MASSAHRSIGLAQLRELAGDWPKTATERANVVWKQMLETNEEPPMDEPMDEALKAYMSRRKLEL